MSKNICLAQDVNELKYVLKNANETLACVPLSLETQLYCMTNNLDFIDPVGLIDNEFHKESLVESEKFVKSINYEKHVETNIKIEIQAFLRFRFNSIILLIELLNKVNQKYSIDKIYISGWNLNFHTIHTYFIDDIVNFIFPNFQIIKISKNNLISKKKNLFSYQIKAVPSYKGKAIIVNNLNYNFRRIIFFIKKNNYKLYVLRFEKISMIKIFLLRLINIYLVNFEKREYKEKEMQMISRINFKYKNIDLSKLLNSLKNKLNSYFLDLEQKNNALKGFLLKNDFSLALTNTARGIDGCIVEPLKNKNWPTICISHGTIAEKFDVYDELYKKIIAETVFNGGSKYFAIQSKIAKNALNTHKINGKSLITGNLIFSQSRAIPKNKKHVLFAVTIKEFCNYQFLGVEMYYEFIKNLKIFEKISNESNLKFIVKVHPAEIRCLKMLKENFPNLIFSKRKIEDLLNKSFVTISFSSTAIEDSLNSQVPVILFDQWKRYKHCESETAFQNNQEAVYYVNESKDLIKCIEKIKSYEKINFDKYIYNTDYKENMKNHIFSMIK